MSLLPQAATALPSFPTVIERHYKHYYYVGPENTFDQYLHCHSNTICVMGLAPLHPILVQGLEVARVDWDVAKIDRSKLSIKGKKKKGGVWVDEVNPLCVIHCTDGSEHLIRATIHGKLIEVNPELESRPSLLTSDPSFEGWIAIVLLKKHVMQNMDKSPSFLSGSQYDTARGGKGIVEDQKMERFEMR